METAQSVVGIVLLTAVGCQDLECAEERKMDVVVEKVTSYMSCTAERPSYVSLQWLQPVVQSLKAQRSVSHGTLLQVMRIPHLLPD